MIDLAAEVRASLAADIAERKAAPECWLCLDDIGPFVQLGPRVYCTLCAKQMREDDRDGWREDD